jgi:hypothetical protein
LKTLCAPAAISSTSFSTAARMSSGSKPATTTGFPVRAANGSKISQPVMMAAWPAATKPSIRVSRLCATTSIAAGTYLCTERIEKFFGGPASATAAVATAVVSKPEAKKTTSSAGRWRAISAAWETE